MLQSRSAESKERSTAARSAAEPEMRRKVHSRVGTGGKVGETASGVAAFRQRFSALQSTIGNQAVLRILGHSAPVIQTKLVVNQPGDPFEQEADRVAERVMRMADSSLAPRLGSTPDAGDTLRRKCSRGGSGGECAECREKTADTTLQRKVQNAAPSQNTIPPIVHEVLRSPGSPLDPATRAFFEPRFGRDLSEIRLHADSTSAESAQAVHALAYTLGPNIVFGSGQYAPATPPGRKLLAHELAHTIQQSHSSSVRDHGSASRGASVQLHNEGCSLQRFASEEHVKIGDIAEPGQMVQISGYGPVRLGELIAMAGDYFETPTQLEQVAKLGTFGKQQIDLVRWKVNGSSGPKPAVGPGVEEAVNTRYEDLASRNQTHFSTGSSPGNSNKERYIDLHTQAIQAGFQAGAFATGFPQFPAHIPEALEGFAEHFLTDAFSAGHVRTPRGELQTYWSGKFPNFQTDLLEFISCNMATYIHDVDKPTGPMGGALSVGDIKDGFHFIVDRNGVRDVVRQKAGDKLNRFSLGDLISIALHDADNRGLDVTSASDASGSSKPFKWRTVGDLKLFPSTPDPAATMTQNMVETAVKFSFGEVQQAIRAGMGSGAPGLSQMTNPANYRALALIPSEDTSSKTNSTFGWKVNDVRSLPNNVKDAVKEEFKPGTAIINGLNQVAVDPCNGAIHSGASWDCFKQVLLADPIEALAKVSESKTCPGSNPCPSLRPAVTCP